VTLSRQEIADRAGVDDAYVGRLVDLGLLDAADDAFSEGDVRRARLYRGLEDAGLPLDALVQAVKGDELSFAFLDHPVYDRFAHLSTRSFREVSEEDGVSLELLMAIREAIGFGQAEEDDPMREDELRIVPIITLQLEMGFDPSVIGRWLRVYGDGLRRIAETEADWWHTQVQVPNEAAGLSGAEVLAVGAEVGEEVSPLLEQALLAIYRANQDHIWTSNLIDEVETALDRAGLRNRMATTPAICFLDITGYTRLTEERGDEAAAALAARLTPLVQRSAERHDGKVVKWLGDGVMFYFGDPGRAVAAALEMLDVLRDAGLPPAHVGIQTGPVVFQDGDYFGRTVNLAARIAGHAEPGQLLVSQEVVSTAGLDDGVSYTAIEPAVLKGLSEAIVLWSATRS
jgi:adenylate cyclase